MVYGLLRMVHGVWSVVLWSAVRTVRGVWSVVYGLWCVVDGAWSVVHGPWRMLHRDVASAQTSRRSTPQGRVATHLGATLP